MQARTTGIVVVLALVLGGCPGGGKADSAGDEAPKPADPEPDPEPDPAPDPEPDPEPEPSGSDAGSDGGSDPTKPDYAGIDEDEESSDLPPGGTKPVPMGNGIAPPAVAGHFDAATWNIRNWYPGKSLRDSKLLRAAGDKADKVVFTLIDKMKIDVIAVQEVYTTGGTPSLTDPTGKFTVLMGAKIYTHVRSGRTEYCPVAFRKTAMTCTDAGVWGTTRGIHWAKCEVPKPGTTVKRTFYMGCGHLTPESSEIAGAIDELFQAIRNTSLTPTAGTDAFILGMDANSYWDGYRKRVWKEKNESSTPHAVTFTSMKGPITQLTYTKMYKINGQVVISNNDRRIVIDDLIWNLKDVLRYKTGTKRVANVQPLTNHPGNSFFLAYYEITDHLPVIASFDVL